MKREEMIEALVKRFVEWHRFEVSPEEVEGNRKMYSSMTDEELKEHLNIVPPKWSQMAKDYSRVLRTGVRIDKGLYRKECISGMILAACFGLIVAIILIVFTVAAFSTTTTASWYSVESCLREGTSGIMANGQPLKDEALTAASWDYAFGTRVKVVNVNNNKSVIVKITDRGPAKRLYKQGRVIDLSRGAFKRIAALREGVVPVELEVVK